MRENQAYFGGPHIGPRRLRDLLAERVAAVPSGGSIDWVTYYFRDRRLARDLLAARQRGVDVRLTLEGRPRTARANDRVVAMLQAPGGLGDGLRLVGDRMSRVGAAWRPRLHEKLYCFSHPRPEALVGSFNPSGDVPEEDPAILREIGDQDRAYNALVALRDPALVEALVSHARRLHAEPHDLRSRFRREANRPLTSGDLNLHFWPRWRPHPVDQLLRPLGRESRVRIASSHLKGFFSERQLLSLAKRGAAVEIIAEHTSRRVPPKTEARLRRRGIAIRRIGASSGTPMHNKFLLIDRPGSRCVIFGSFNWTPLSRLMNREIAVVCHNDPALFDAFDEQWHALAAAR